MRFDFWNNFGHKHKILQPLGAAVLTVANTSWAWAGTPMGTKDESSEGKYVWATAMLLLSMAFGVMGGVDMDKLAKLAKQYTPSATFFSRNGSAVLGGFLGVAYGFVSNYWLFTNVATPGSELPEGAKQTLYALAEFLGLILLGTGFGMRSDYRRQIEQGLQDNGSLEFYKMLGDDNRIINPSR